MPFYPLSVEVPRFMVLLEIKCYCFNRSITTEKQLVFSPISLHRNKDRGKSSWNRMRISKKIWTRSFLTSNLSPLLENDDNLIIRLRCHISFTNAFSLSLVFFWKYRRPSLYAIDRDLKNWLAYDEFAYNETNSVGKLEDTFL